MLYGSDKAYGELSWVRRWGYRLLGELHLPGRLRAQQIIKEMRALGLWGRPHLSVLDAGCGKGGLSFYLAERFPGWRVTALDADEKVLARMGAAQRALRLPNLSIVKGDLLALGMPEQFDLVICADVLEHIERDDLAIKNLATALRPDGVLIVTAPSVPQRRHLPTVAWRDRRLGLDGHDGGHVRSGYEPQEMQALLESRGLRFERCRWTFGRFGTLMFDLFFTIGDNRPNPLVYLTLYPLLRLLSVLDLIADNRDGSAILAVGRKG